jgi:hypothetical protein
MRSLLTVSILALMACAPAQQSPYFAGCIEYENEYQNTAGEAMYYAVKPRNWFYVPGTAQ